MSRHHRAAFSPQSKDDLGLTPLLRHHHIRKQEPYYKVITMFTVKSFKYYFCQIE